MGKDKAAEILKSHFKTLYDYAGIEWNPNNDEYVEQFVDGLEEIIEEKTNELINDLQKEV